MCRFHKRRCYAGITLVLKPAIGCQVQTKPIAIPAENLRMKLVHETGAHETGAPIDRRVKYVERTIASVTVTSSGLDWVWYMLLSWGDTTGEMPVYNSRFLFSITDCKCP